MGEGKHLVDPKELVAILEAREEVEEASDISELFHLKDSSFQSYKELVEALSHNFLKEDIEAAKRNTIKLQYLTKLREEIESRLGQLGA